MPATRLPALFVLAGLIHCAATPAPVPTQELAAMQLRALNHRFLDTRIDPGGDLIEALAHEDFFHTAADGAWHERADFVAQLHGQAARDGVLDDMQVRLFGRVALVHGVFTAPAEGGRSVRVRFTDVHVWSGVAWRLVSAQESPLRDTVRIAQQTGMAPAHAPWQGQDPAGDDERVLALLNANYVQAFRSADVAWYDAHLAPDYLVISGDGLLRDRAAALAGFAQPTFATAMKSFPVDKVTVRRFDDVALIHAENAYGLKDGRTGVSRYTDIWHKRDGRWYCIAAHITVYKAP